MALECPFRVEAWGFVCGSVCARVRACARHYAPRSLSVYVVVNGCVCGDVCVHVCACTSMHIYMFDNDVGAERDWARQGGVRARALKHMRMRHGANYKPTLTARNRVTHANRTPLRNPHARSTNVCVRTICVRKKKKGSLSPSPSIYDGGGGGKKR